VCSKKGLSERFDSTIGAGSVLMPFGGKHQLTPTQVMAAKLPVLNGETKTCSVMSWGYNPYLTEADPFAGSYLAVVESVSKLVASGAPLDDCYLTFQEYFEKPGSDPSRWGKPFAALLGAMEAQLDLGFAAIGGKDSMSGSFDQLDVPPTLVSFAITTAKTDAIRSPEFKLPVSRVVLLAPEYDDRGIPTTASLKANYDLVHKLLASNTAISAWTPTGGGVAEGILKMCLGNRIGFRFADGLSDDMLFRPMAGAFILELAGDADVGVLLGETTLAYTLRRDGETVDLAELQSIYEGRLEDIFSCNIKMPEEKVENFSFTAQTRPAPKVGVAKPRVLIPVFPGTNCEFDTARAIARAGAEPEIMVLNNPTPAGVAASVERFAELIEQSQIIFIPGGFSGGDEPDGSGKFITAFFRNPQIKEGVARLLGQRDGLMAGICNGFQALIKLGLVPYGEIIDTDDTCPTLTYNTIGRHQSRIVRTRIASNKSPWLAKTEVGQIYAVPISHGEGRFLASPEMVAKLAANGQIATQYVDLAGNASMDILANPNGSIAAIEGITSPDGRVFGKMGHSERIGDGLYRNVDGRYDIGMFASAVDYYKI
ncbi:MAG: phosphoribosylformylglycinamidine synthase subunit PurQ, partial [Clostridia bacterium]|nr:phosphoribosylformylglycinamidine synthase subunit PurQ [Clostridia bacterium]